MATTLNEHEMADIAALADGTIPADRRGEVEAWVAASPERTRLLDRQRRSLAAAAVLSEEEVPAALSAAVWQRAQASAGRRKRRGVFALALSAAGVAAAVIIAVIAITLAGPSAPSVADAAALGLRPATAPAPLPAGQGQLAAQVQGVVFPDFSAQYGWRAVGTRHGQVGGRRFTTVYYAKGDRRAAYVIVAGPPLQRPADVRSTALAGVRYQTLSLHEHMVVTWRRGGHTCILIGNASPARLLALASWNGSSVY